MDKTNDLEWLMGLIARLLDAWKPILFGTIVLTAFAFSGLMAWQTTLYSSRMILPITPATRVKIQAGTIASGVSVEPLTSMPNMYSVTSVDPNQERAKATLERAMDQIIAASKPTGSARESIERTMGTLQASIAGIAAARLRAINDDRGSDAWRAVALANLSTVNLDAETRLVDLRRSLDGLRQEDILLTPTAAVALSRRNKLEQFATTVALSFIAMVLFILFRDEARDRYIPLLRKAQRKAG
ncbi:MAG: hypothetical protein WAV72_02160 [Bradyrhizobium sp.]